ncbi:hypothetical protein AGLY_008977 [Aphis glycines]|uniref:Uncharacterized protein n=1 Tax=Aphis glycines TaxID=307491 RepID=A0A6G0TLH0_APHGL|nr:hypothetical protein AGLY_008977 [Aphis glycines]
MVAIAIESNKYTVDGLPNFRDDYNIPSQDTYFIGEASIYRHRYLTVTSKEDIRIMKSLKVNMKVLPQNKFDLSCGRPVIMNSTDTLRENFYLLGTQLLIVYRIDLIRNDNMSSNFMFLGKEIKILFQEKIKFLEILKNIRANIFTIQILELLECINIAKVINTSNTLNYETHPSREIIKSSLKLILKLYLLTQFQNEKHVFGDGTFNAPKCLFNYIYYIFTKITIIFPLLLFFKQQANFKFFDVMGYLFCNFYLQCIRQNKLILNEYLNKLSETNTWLRAQVLFFWVKLLTT